jgi:hypothetical protein
MPSPFPRRNKRTLSLVLAERPSVSVSASRSKSLRLINALLRLLSEDVADAVDLADADVVMDHLEVAEATSNVVMDKVAVKAVVDVRHDPTSNAGHQRDVLVQVALLSTPTIQALSQAWDHRISTKSL